MCGISGFNWKDKDRVSEMVEVLAHRGPDANGVFVDENMSLGHNRLSIIDLSSNANQPMFDDKKELAIVFNGEIYNFRELRKELEKEYPFQTKSDTEVILAGYRKWGKDVVERLNGMFSFAIWNTRTKELFCARDHAGIKPFYYYWDGTRFIFASEIKAILRHDIPRVLDKGAFNHYMRVLYVPEPMTMIRDIYKLPPKHSLTLKGNDLVIKEYGRKEEKSHELSYNEAKHALRGKVIDAVHRQMVSDVPVGIYLSGGIDSSAVLFSALQKNNNIETFSVGFTLEKDEEAEKFNHDLHLAKKTAAYFGAKHNNILISSKDVQKYFEEAALQCDDIVSHPTAVAMMLLAKFAKEKVSVVLTGSGGDELFGGYDRYRMAVAAEYYKKLPRLLRAVGNLHPRVSKLGYRDVTDLFSRFMFQKDTELSKVISAAVFRDSAHGTRFFEEHYISEGNEGPADRLMRTDRRSWLPDYFFMLSDKMSMKSALEERVPLTDKELTEFSGNIPRSYKVDLFRTKKILKDAFRNDLPGYLFEQPKRGWFSPGAKWFREPDFMEFSKNVLSKEYYKGTSQLFNWIEVNDMLDKHIRKEKYNLAVLWAILSFQVWARGYQIKV